MTDIRTPASRATDPVSSHEAERAHTDSGARRTEQARARAAVSMHPGYTSFDLAQITGIERHVLGRRLPELEAVGLVRRGPIARSSNGRRGVTWLPVPVQGRLL